MSNKILKLTVLTSLVCVACVANSANYTGSVVIVNGEDKGKISTEGDILLEGNTIEIKGGDTRGFYVTGDTSGELRGNTVSVSEVTYGVRGDKGASITISGKNSISVSTKERGSTFGIYSYNNSSIRATSDGTISVVSNTYGVYSAYKGSIIDLAARNISVLSNNELGVGANNDSSVNVTAEDSVTILSANKYAIYAKNNSAVNVTGKEIFLSGEADVLWAETGGTINVGSSYTETLNVIGTINALWHDSNNPGGKVNLQAKTINISSETDALWAQNNDDTLSSPADERAHITVIGDEISITGKRTGINAYSGSTVDIIGNLSITSPRVIDTRGNSTTISIKMVFIL